MDTCICMAEALCCPPGTITTQFVNRLDPNTKQKVFFFLNGDVLKVEYVQRGRPGEGKIWKLCWNRRDGQNCDI